MELHIEFSDGSERTFVGFSPVTIIEWEQDAPNIKSFSIRSIYWLKGKLYMDLAILFSNSRKRTFFGLAPIQNEESLKKAGVSFKKILLRKPFMIEDELRTAITDSAGNAPGNLIGPDQDMDDPDPWSGEDEPIRWDNR
ncbi:MAG: hypothetical protein ACOCTM_01860 [Bacteroidota bacterium]